MYRAAFPDLQIRIDDIIAEGQMVAFRWTSSGTHRGELFGTQPTGKQITTSGISILRTAGGKVAEDWVNWDTLGLLQQIGAVKQ
jgi:predicted ester cyclase